jgi:threonine/homoserine/homoserine lactone efflux protein
VLTPILAFSLAAALIVLLPGPDTLVVVRALLRGGAAEAVRTVAGVLTGLAVWVVAAALGLSALLRASHAGYDVLRVAGAAYLVWLGVQSLRSRSRELAPPPRRGPLGRGYLAGLATDLLNPKVGVFFVTFLPGFVPHGASVGVMSLIFGGIFILEGAAYFAVLIGLARTVTGWMQNVRIRRRLDAGTGLVLIGLGVRLAVEPG